MAIDAWLPNGYLLPDSAKVRVAKYEGADWQIYETAGSGSALVVSGELAGRWLSAGLIHEGEFNAFAFGHRRLQSISSSEGQLLMPVSEAQAPDNKTDALAFALALKASRSIDAESPLQDAIYVEKITRLLPTYSITSRTDDDVVLGYWLTGGAPISAKAFRRLRQTLSWLGAGHLKDVVQSAGFAVAEIMPEREQPKTEETSQQEEARVEIPERSKGGVETDSVFELAGRPELAAFFNEHVVDIIKHRERYKSLGIGFPSAVILHGPPGCGKTFAVERLIDFLGWPSYQIDASSIGSKYIHETSKKVAEVFERAMENSPSVIVIDEMEAFLADREMGSGHHRVEEVAEFLRRIPEAVKNDVLIIAMTNRIEMIDPAIQRRGRFDHVLSVDFANELEIRSLLDNLLAALPIGADVDAAPLAKQLSGRPLSDVSFVVREGARLAARSGKDKLDQESLLLALRSSPARSREGGEQPKRRIGFI